ncbi:MaoC family dehydratase [Corynebacterium aquilae]|uniref:Acyl dehydratase n=1 Tax=Corynebacterium aquilae DSM 44791 TaxID=1431546 RepID=A0A1L7CH39_9CORY|nr:MaoC family dehydratase [Corynebacterium aquilae]APT85168.1 acyl dehydratase [Corynebacterium aquilae DSM 44791]
MCSDNVPPTQPSAIPAGRSFEDFSVGDVFVHPLGRTITQADNIWSSLIAQNQGPLHINAHYSAGTAWGRPLVDSTFTLAVITGQSVGDLSLRIKANLGWDRVRCPNPLFEGDTLYSRSEVLQVRPSASHPDAGIVRVRTMGYRQDGTVVMTCERTLLVFKRGCGPAGAEAVQPVIDERTARAIEGQ